MFLDLMQKSFVFGMWVASTFCSLSGQLAGSVLSAGERRLGVHLTGPHVFINPHHVNVQFRTCI
jgi:hypothetical protein